MHCSERVIFTNASAKDSELSAGVVTMNVSVELKQVQRIGIRTTAHWNIHTAELIAICQAVDVLHDAEVQKAFDAASHARLVSAVSDS